MDTSVTSILQQLRALEDLVTNHGMTTEELHRLELELRTILERIRFDSEYSERSQAHTKADCRRQDGTGQVRGNAKDSLKKDGGD